MPRSSDGRPEVGPFPNVRGSSNRKATFSPRPNMNEHGAQTLAHEDVPQPGHESTKLQANPGQDDKFNRPFNPSEKLNTMIQGE